VIVINENEINIPNNLLVHTDIVEYIDHKMIPHVVEPSVGIDRVSFAMLYHLMKKRQDAETRVVFRLPEEVSSFKLALFVLSNNEKLVNYYENKIKPLINKNKSKIYFDFSSTQIGKRYVRADMIGIPYVVTIDFDSIITDTVTIRQRDDLTQVRISINEIINYC